MDQLLLGTAIQKDHKAIVVETRPGFRVAFPGGQAMIRNEVDMVHLLRRDDLIIQIDEWVDFVPKWLEQCTWDKPLRAEVNLPEGFEIDRTNAGSPYMRCLTSDVRGRGRPAGSKNKPQESPAQLVQGDEDL